MTLTLEEIVQHEERLETEIMDRECLLAAFRVLHRHAANGKSPKMPDLALLGSVIPLPALNVPLLLPKTEAAPALPPVQPYMHPELEVIGWGYGSAGKVVWWAIQRMTNDYSVQDIAALLQREGYLLKSPEISVALTRFKRRGQIEEMEWGCGRRATIFHKPETAASPITEAINPTGDTISTAVLAAIP